MYSEEELGEKFEKFLKESTIQHSILPKYDLIFEEVQSVQGIPDYVGLVFNTANEIEVIKKILRMEMNSINNISKILPYIKRKEPHGIEYLSRKTNLQANTINNVLLNLKNEKIINEIEESKYILSIDFDFSDVEIWSFELKLKNWKRAVFQSLRYKIFSDYVYIVMPDNMREIINTYKKTFRDFNIGVLIYDEKRNEFNRLIRANKNFNKSKNHTAYVLLQILNKIKKGDRVK